LNRRSSPERRQTPGVVSREALPISSTRGAERSIVVLATFPDSERSAEDELGELSALTQSSGAVVVASVQQNRPSPDGAYFIGRGKTAELGEVCARTQAEVVVFGHDLSPAQGRNLERELKVRVIDRTQLIMDLFASRAQTHQARLQVELAQLQYLLPRLRRMWTHLDRFRGGVGLRGPGETQLESDRRSIRRRIDELKERLRLVERQHELHRSARVGRFQVGLIGYTNAGKSTLFNGLTGSGVLTEDRPFSTLDTRTKTWKLPNGPSVLLSDTIGFVHRLPHHLIASFHATLAEAVEADLLLHVVDGSSRDVALRIQSVVDVLRAIGAEDRPRLLVFNKIDRVQDRVLLGAGGSDSVLISAHTGAGLELLQQRVVQLWRRSLTPVRLRIPAAEVGLLSQMRCAAELSEPDFDGQFFRTDGLVPSEWLGILRRFVLDPADGVNGRPGLLPRRPDPITER